MQPLFDRMVTHYLTFIVLRKHLYLMYPRLVNRLISETIDARRPLESAQP